jgi:DUF917 family protein
VEAIALGAGILGTGGGGNPYLGKIRLWEHIKQGRSPVVVSPEQVPDDARVSTVGEMGAPTVSIERLPQDFEMLGAVNTLERFIGEKIGYVISGEIGGANSMSALLVSAQSGRIAIDGDGMGRAFPELQMNTFSINGIPLLPLAQCDVRGQTTIISHVLDAKWSERIARGIVVQLGGSSGNARAMRGAEMKRAVLRHTMSLAKRIGLLVRHARERRDDPAMAVVEMMNGKVLFRGKIVDVTRRTTAGFARGQVRIRSQRGDLLEIDIQNENLIARQDGAVMAAVPDLITLVTEEDGEPVSTEVLRYGLRVVVLMMPCAPQLRTEQALRVVGPRAFGYDIDYRPMDGRWPIASAEH